MRPALAFLTGIALYVYGHWQIPFVFLIASGLTALFLHVAVARRWLSAFRFGSLIGVGFIVTIFIIGNRLAAVSDPTRRSTHFTHHWHIGNEWIVRLMEPPQPSARSIRLLVAVLARKHNNVWVSATGKALLYLPKTEASVNLDYGSLLWIQSRLQPVQAARNPQQFDQRRYLTRRHIFSVTYVPATRWRLLSEKQVHPLYEAIYDLHLYFRNVLEKYIPTVRELSVIQTISLGYRQALDDTIRQHFARAGVMHVLAVSGMHVGILYAALMFLLSLIPSVVRKRYVALIVVLPAVWLFAFLTGLSGSVWRAATMFTLLLVGQTTNRHIHPINILAASSILICSIEPRMLSDMGLQFSYAAMVGIFLWYTPLASWLPRGNRVIDFLWRTIALTLAAQVLTLPLAIYYFQQIPMYFLLANIVVVPVTGLLLPSALLVFGLHWWHDLTVVVSNLTTALAWVLNEFTWRIQLLPAAVLYTAKLSVIQWFFLSLALAGFAQYLYTRRYNWLVASFASFILLLGFHSISQLQKQTQVAIVVYSLRHASCVDFVLGDRVVRFRSGQPALPFEASYLNQNIRWQGRKLLHEWDLEQVHSVSFSEKGFLFHNGFFRMPKLTGVLLTPDHVSNLGWQKRNVDLVLVFNHPTPDVENIASYYQPEQIIADGSSRATWLRQLKRSMAKYKIPVRTTQEEAVVLSP